MHPKYLQFMAKMDELNRADNYRADAGETAVMARALEHVETEVTKVIYADLRALDFVPLIAGVDPGAEGYVWQSLDLRSYADLIGNGAKDLPSSEGDVVDQTAPIRSFGNHFGYTVQDLRSFALARKRFTNVQIDQIRAMSCRRGIDEKHDDMIAFGDARVGITGFLNNANVAILNAGVGLNGGWTGATPDQILADLLAMVNAVRSQTLDVVEPDTIGLPSAKHTICTTRKLGTGTDTTIAKFFEANTGVKLAKWTKLKNAGSGGAQDRMVCYKRDPMIAGAIVPIVFQTLAPQLQGFRWNIYAEGRSGGTVVRLPAGMVYGDGI